MVEQDESTAEDTRHLTDPFSPRHTSGVMADPTTIPSAGPQDPDANAPVAPENAEPLTGVNQPPDASTEAVPTAPAGSVDPGSDEAAQVAEVETPVPDGPIDVVMGWVGDDPAKARRALDAENAKDKQRGTLIERLTHIVG